MVHIARYLLREELIVVPSTDLMPAIGHKQGHQKSSGPVLWKNVFANFAGTAATGAISILALSQYVRTYGMQSWGHIAALIVVVNLLMLTEVGANQIYISAFNASCNKSKTFEQYFGLMIALGGTATLCAMLVLFGLSETGFKGGFIAQGYQLICAALALYLVNFLNNFLYAHLSAAQRQLTMNVRQTGFLLLKTVFALAFAHWVSADVRGYFIMFSLIGFIELLINMAGTKDIQYSFQGVIKGVAGAPRFLKTISGLSFGVIVGILAANLDKIYLSTVNDAAVFAAYSVTCTVAMYFMQLQYPVMKAFFPVIAKLHHGDDKDAKRRVIWQQLWIINAVIVPPLCIAFYLDEQILELFALDMLRYPDVGLLFRILLICVYLNAIYHIFYQQMMTVGASTFIFRINLMSLISSAVMLIFLGSAYPVLSGGWAWLAMSSIQLFGGLIFMNSRRKNVVG